MELENRPLRFGFIGTGSILDHWLVPALAQVAGAIAWSVMSRDRAKAEPFVAKHGLKAERAAFDSIDEFLADPFLDAVIVASPDALHACHALACARVPKPKHIFVEKPMTTESASGRELIAACAAANVRLGVGYHLRWHAGHRALRQALLEGKIGLIRHMDICWTYRSAPSDWRAHPQTGKWWSLAAVGTHAIDLVVWLLAPTCGPVVEQRAILSSPVYGGPHDETAVVSLRFASGATAQIVSSVIFRAPRRAQIYGSEGSAQLMDTLGPLGAGSIVLKDQPLLFQASNPYVGELRDFVQAIVTGRQPESDGENGLANIEILEKACSKY